MVGYPFYNDEKINDDEVYFSDYCVLNGKFFAYGFILGVMTSPSVAFASDVESCPCVDNPLEYSPTTPPSPTPAPPQGNVPTAARNTVHGLAALAGCSAAGTSCSKVAKRAAEASAEKLSQVSGPALLGAAVCIGLTGFCVGKLTTAAIDKALGFK